MDLLRNFMSALVLKFFPAGISLPSFAQILYQGFLVLGSSGHPLVLTYAGIVLRGKLMARRAKALKAAFSVDTDPTSAEQWVSLAFINV